MVVYLQDWAESGREGMLSDFGIGEEAMEGVDVLLAVYAYEDYSGDAFVLFRKNGKLYEVNGSHCSCHGLSEGNYYGDSTTQWQPEETTVEALQKRLADGACYEFSCVKDHVRAVVASLSN